MTLPVHLHVDEHDMGEVLKLGTPSSNTRDIALQVLMGEHLQELITHLPVELQDGVKTIDIWVMTEGQRQEMLDAARCVSDAYRLALKRIEEVLGSNGCEQGSDMAQWIATKLVDLRAHKLAINTVQECVDDIDRVLETAGYRAGMDRLAWLRAHLPTVDTLPCSSEPV